jgi:Flp pilus assembly protein TadG
VLLMPVLAVMMFAAIDVGNVMYTRIRLSTTIAAGTSYVTTRSADVANTNADDLARSTANIVGNANGTDWARAKVIVNNGPEALKNTGNSALTNSTTPGTTNGLCYCPTSNSNFGAAATCGTICGTGGVAGRWVRISAQRRVWRLWSTYGLLADGQYMTKIAMVQTE